MRNDYRKICNPRQAGGIETAVLDNGSGRGTRVAWVNTGSGLRYKIAIDRAMDIVDAFYAENSLAWLSHAATTAPHPDALAGTEWLHSFNGGLVATCGLSHVGPPEDDEYGTRGIHGRIGNLPAEVVHIEQPDPARGQLTMSLTGIIRETCTFGPHLELKRTIRSELGKPEIHLHDEVCNRGNTPAPHMILYHCNLGYPLVDEDATIIWNGKTTSRGEPQDDRIFAGDHDYSVCPGPWQAHCGYGEACGFISPVPESDGRSRTGVINRDLGLALGITFRPDQLPCLTNWQHWGPGEYVTGLEPGTHFPVGQTCARRQDTLIMLGPEETRKYDLIIRAATETNTLPAP